MANSEAVKERTEATGTWSFEAPINLFSFATYRKGGKVITLPVGVAGDHITGQHSGTGQPQS